MSTVKSDTPMMKQFNALKREHPDCILFFRAGDFYEMFGEDAEKASAALNIALTTRNKNSENAVPMAGVPYHAFDTYLNRLTAAGFKVAIAEQMEDPAQAKGVVRREVVRVVTPGTTTSDPLLEQDRNHYLMALEYRGETKPFGLALIDLSTGRLEVAQFDKAAETHLMAFLVLEQPAEILLPEASGEQGLAEFLRIKALLEKRFHALDGRDVHLEVAPAPWFAPKKAEKALCEQYQTTSLAGFGLEGWPEAVGATGALLAYLRQTQKTTLAHLTPPRPRLTEAVMWLDEATVDHLEIFDNRSPGGKKHTLFAVINHTRTPMGARMLRRWLGQPLVQPDVIEARLDAVEELYGDNRGRTALSETLARIRDLERVIGRVSLPTVGIADVVALRDALGGVQFLPPQLGAFSAPLLVDLSDNFDSLDDIYRYIQERFMEEPQLKATEGGFIAEGIIPELDKLRALQRDSRQVITQLEQDEREKTGISSLKIRYNRVFGYYLEISRLHQEKVPLHYTRKQTLVNAERYITPELKEVEEEILGAEARISELEYEAFTETRNILRGYARRMQITAERIAMLDVLTGLAEAAVRNAYVRPGFLPSEAPRRLVIKGGRHPVIEQIDFDEPFIPNDILLDEQKRLIMLITGPNMAGKSTVMRQVALIQLMAQAGGFVPVESAELPLVDRIFTRVGASDNLSRGQSTFMLEMNEAANILNNASARSLVILDEIGRGTSTYDGISIAWAMVEYLHQLGALTLFATHYHELTQLARELPRLINQSLSIHEEGENLVFTRKLIEGEADKSYGIQVAKLAGLPKTVVFRAHEVMDSLVQGSNGALVLSPNGDEASGNEDSLAEQGKGQSVGRGTSAPKAAEQTAQGRQQLSFLAEAHPMLEQIRKLDVNRLTPLEALTFLHQAKTKLEEGDK